MKKKLNIGLDIGVTSVGWSLIDEDHNIVDMGVRLFDDIANEKDGKLENQKRRTARGARRRLRRARTRKDSFINFLINQKWIDNFDEIYPLINIDITKFNVDNPIQLRVKALKEKITKEELIFLLFNYLEHRGYFHITEETLEENKEIVNSKDANLKSNKFPSENILKFYNENGYYKASSETSRYSVWEYKDEIIQILKIQNLSSEFIDKYIDIFTKRREFWQGPGSEKSPTPYGLYREKNGKVEKIGDSLWDCLLGKCSVYPNEKRGLKHSPIAEVFNLINDINRISVYKNKLDSNFKKQIYYKYVDSFGSMEEKKKAYNFKPKELIKIANTIDKNLFGKEINDETEIKGFRVDKSEKPLITELKNYRYIVAWMLSNKYNNHDKFNNLFDSKMLNDANEIFNMIAKEQDLNQRLNILKKICPNSNDESNKKLINNDLKKLTQTHSLSYKAMNEYIEFASSNLDSSDEQMTFFSEKINSKNLQYKKYIDKHVYDDEILPPTTKRAFYQTVNVVNKILKLYKKEYEFNNITIELARDKNTAEERKNISKFQKDNEKFVSEILKENNIINTSLNSTQVLRLKLWKEQDGRDIYDLECKKININDVISGFDLDIDHIIPYSICHDDSINNKVLTSKHNNQQEKKNLTPYQLFQKKGEFEKFKSNVEKYIKNKKKKYNLLLEIDPFEDLISSFVGRHLVDTRYASRVVLNTFQDFFKSNKDYGDVKIKVIRGAITNFARYNLLKLNNKAVLQKDRDIYCHHAIDATIACFLGMNKNINGMLNHSKDYLNGYAFSKKYDVKINDDNSKSIINKETGEVFDILSWKSPSNEIVQFTKQLQEYNVLKEKDSDDLKFGSNSHKIKYSRMITKNKNVQLSNETIYSFKWINKDPNGEKIENPTDGYIISKLDLINSKSSDLEKYFKDNKIVDKDVNSLFCFKSDKKLYSELKTIFNRYWKPDGKENPFIEFMKSELNKDNIKHIEILNKKIKYLRYINKTKNIKNIIVLNNHNKNAILENLNPISIRIYKNDDKKFVFFPINQKVLKNTKNGIEIDNDKLMKNLKYKKISNLNKFFEINRGFVFEDKNNENNLIYSVGGSENMGFEFKLLYAKNDFFDLVKKTKNKRIFVVPSNLVENYYYLETDELGNVYKKIDIKKYFENEV